MFEVFYCMELFGVFLSDSNGVCFLSNSERVETASPNERQKSGSTPNLNVIRVSQKQHFKAGSHNAHFVTAMKHLICPTRSEATTFTIGKILGQ